MQVSNELAAAVILTVRFDEPLCMLITQPHLVYPCAIMTKFDLRPLETPLPVAIYGTWRIHPCIRTEVQAILYRYYADDRIRVHGIIDHPFDHDICNIDVVIPATESVCIFIVLNRFARE